MNLVETAVRWRHGTLAAYLLFIIFGILAFYSLPMELQPGGDVPKISITTTYPGAGPTTIEELITRPLEDLLEEVEGVQEMTSSSSAGSSSIIVEFEWGVDIKLKLIEVINKLNQVQDLPAEANEPDIQISSGGGGGNAMMWIVLRARETDGAKTNADHFRDLVEEEMIPELRRVQGTSRFIVIGGRQKQVHVAVDPQKLASRGLSISGLTNALRTNNRDIRGGPLVTGRREYRVSTKGRAKAVEQLDRFVLRRDSSGSVLVSDVAKVEIGRRFEDSFFLFKGNPAGAVGIVRQNGANVTILSAKLRDKIRELEQRFQARGENVAIDVAYDESGYVDQSISLVQSNLLIGAALATIVLLLFLGSLRTVLVCAISIPTTLVTVFVMLWAFDQTLNILTLAGLAFAVGMVIDNAIVVVENVFTQMEAGRSPVRAAIEGAQEVSGALVASTLTTIAVFLPLVMVEGEVGRVFRAFGVTLAAAVGLSFFSAITLVPMLAGALFTREDAKPDGAGGVLGFVARASRRFGNSQERLIRFMTDSAAWSLDPDKRGRRISVLGSCLALLTAAYLLLPSADYLPGGNRNLIFWLLEPYPGTSVKEGREITAVPQNFLNSHEKVGDTFLLYATGFRGIGVKLKPELVSGPALKEMQGVLFGVGGGFAGFRQSFPIRFPIFNDPGKEIQVRVVGPDLNRLSEMSKELQQQLGKTEGVLGARADFVFGAPELEVLPDLRKLAALEMESAEVAAVVESALGGRFASEFVEGKETLDVVVKLQDVFVNSPEDLRQLQLVTPTGRRVQVQDVAKVVESTGPDSVNHVNTQRSISLTVNIAPDAPLGATVDRVQSEVLDTRVPHLPPGYRIYIGGTADALTTTLTQLGSVFAFSLLIVYLLLMALYRSFSYPFIILMTVPLGLTGAVISLVVAQMIPGTALALDMITAIGFVVLTGVVVNNAILLVDRALQLQRSGVEYWESVRQATHDRLRAILMSASTSVLGMLPLALIPGEGAELYQGLGVVLVGGLTFATFLTPTVVPALMGLFKDFGLVSEQMDPLESEERKSP